MTVYVTHRKIIHQGNGSLKTFSYNFEIPDEDYLFVYLVDADGVITLRTDYTATGIGGDESGGNITFNSYAPLSTERVMIVRDVDYIQETDLIEGGLFRAETVEDTEDYHRFVDLQLKETLDRTIRVPITEDGGDNLILPEADDRANKYLFFDEDGDVYVRSGTSLLVEHTHADGTQGGQIHHHILLGLTDDDHPQYHTDGRGDLRYYTQSQVDALLIHNHDSDYSPLGHTHTGVYAPTPHDNTHHSQTYITSAGVTFENLNTNGDVGTASDQVAAGNHIHNLNDDLSSDESYSGETSQVEIGETVSWGDVLYLKNDGKYYKADADTGYTKVPGEVMSLYSGAAASNQLVLKYGFARKNSWSWTTGSKLYISKTAGGMIHTVYSSSGDIVQVVAYAKSSNIVYFNPNYILIERA